MIKKIIRMLKNRFNSNGVAYVNYLVSFLASIEDYRITYIQELS